MQFLYENENIPPELVS